MTKIFLTGITGLVGSAFATALLKERDDVQIVTLARKSPVKTAAQRVDEIIREQCAFDACPEIADKVLSSIQVIEGDVVDLDPETFAAMPETQGVNVVFHCAADVNLGKDPNGTTFRINFNGTQNVVALAKLLDVREIHYVSTAYVAGKLDGRAIEDNPIDSGFNNPYEESKFKAEQLVRNSGIPFSIYRPSVIVGRLADGKIRKPLAFYRILEFLGKLKKHRCAKLGLNPVDIVDVGICFMTEPAERVYFVPIDYVQHSITNLFQKPVRNKTYHITGDSPVSTLQINAAICRVLRITGMDVCPKGGTPSMDEKLMSRLLGDLLPYFSSNIIFDQTNVRNELGTEALDWEIGPKGLDLMMSAFLHDFFPTVKWVQDITTETE